MNILRIYKLALILAAALILPGPSGVMAELQPSSDLLLPWFEVDLEGGAHTTLFALANSSAEPVDVLVSIQTSWGIPVLSSKLAIAGGQVETVDLRDWLVLGSLPSGPLGAGELAHIQAALTGRPSPRDGLYYASPPALPGRAVGSITFRVQGTPRPGALWGDFILHETGRGSAFAEGLVNLDPMVEPRPDCSRHGLRFLIGPQAEMASELRLWTRQRGEPSATPESPEASRVHTTIEVFDEAGRLLATHGLELPPVVRISLLNLVGNEPFGRIDLTTGADSFAGVLVSDGKGMAMVLPAVCLPAETRPKLQLNVLLNGERTLALPGPSLPVGEMIDWTYVITNTGGAPLSGILVSDAQGIVIDCPGEMLAPGESMTCTGMNAALACQQEIAAQVTAQTPDGETVEAGGSACYFGGTYGRAAIDLETSVAGQDADVPPGPSLEVFPLRSATSWEYHVRNTGDLPLSGLTVSGERGRAPDCLKDALAPGESTACHLDAWPELGLNRNVSKAAGVTSCGLTVEDGDITYYFGVEPKTAAQIELRALVGGSDSSVAPGPIVLAFAGNTALRTYVVTNVGEVLLFDLWVTEQGERASCPETPLAPGDSMTCTLVLNTLPGRQQSEVTVYGYRSPGDPSWDRSVSATVLSSYFGAAPALDLKVFINGEVADTPPGPEIPEGSLIEWTYQATNQGNTHFFTLDIADEQRFPIEGCQFAYVLTPPGSSRSCSEVSRAAAGPQRRIIRAVGAPFLDVNYWGAQKSWTNSIIDYESTYYVGVPAGSKGGKP